MIQGYGEIRVDGELEFTVGSWTINIISTSRNNVIEYRREYSGDDKVYLALSRRNARIIGTQKLLVQPIYPVLVPKKLTTSILVKYSTEVTMAPGEQLEYYILMPVDIALLSVKNQSYTLIDVFNVREVKYALYGSIEVGIVARHGVSKIYFDEESALKDLETGLALVKVKAYNKSREWVTLTRILLEANPLKLYYEEHTWKAYSRIINFNVNSPRTATITYSDVPGARLIEVIDPPELRVPFMVSKTSMIWGL